MIVYGTRSTQLAKQIVADKCTNCGTQNSIDLHVFQKYAHVFWIPFFPIGKTGVSQCDHCKQVLKEKEMPPGLKQTCQDLKAQSKTPIWTFSGLALVAILIAIGVISDQKKTATNAVLITQPHKGDVLEIRNSDKQYTLLRVEDVKGDSVYFRLNNFETDLQSGLSKIKEKGDAAYGQDIYALPKQELKAMFDKGDVLDIERR